MAKRSKYSVRTATIKGRRFRLYIADGFFKKMNGLMGWNELGSNEGMLFIFKENSRPGIWMLNMKFPIDIIWLDRSMRIVHIVENARPCRSIFDCPTYRPGRNSKYVVELRSGSVKALRLRRGVEVLMRT